MDWIMGLQKAIDYMEDHLLEPLDIRAVAGRAYVSSFHFQRVFSALCGFTVGEYIRNRRLTWAGFALLTTRRKIVDIALDCGYETPESFTRAFTRFHGVSPTAARNGSPLRSFARLSISLSLKGGESMNYRIETKEGFSILVKKRMFSADDAVSAKEIPLFWEECQKDGVIERLAAAAPKDGVLGGMILGACLEDGGKDQFPYAIGAEYSGGEVPAGFELVEIPPNTWAVFDATGTMPTAIQQLWHRVFAEFFPASDYQPAGTLDLELYTDGDMGSPDYKSAVWVAVTPKQK